MDNWGRNKREKNENSGFELVCSASIYGVSTRALSNLYNGLGASSGPDTSLDSHNGPVRWVPLLSLVNRGGNWGTGRSGNSLSPHIEKEAVMLWALEGWRQRKHGQACGSDEVAPTEQARGLRGQTPRAWISEQQCNLGRTALPWRPELRFCTLGRCRAGLVQRPEEPTSRQA